MLHCVVDRKGKVTRIDSLRYFTYSVLYLLSHGAGRSLLWWVQGLLNRTKIPSTVYAQFHVSNSQLTPVPGSKPETWTKGSRKLRDRHPQSWLCPRLTGVGMITVGVFENTIERRTAIHLNPRHIRQIWLFLALTP